ncbi:MAG: 50S ribosomal protein L5 [Bacilli bacterium]|nr:50S ribosomal protein L5 [Bacilli bacterium]
MSSKDFFMKKFKYYSVMQMPKLEKVVINVGIKKSEDLSKKIDSIFEELQLITGQRPIITKAKKSIASFNLRKGQEIGCKVTLRRKRMLCFLDKLINITLPHVRDFRGLNTKSFDGRGNYALGIRDQLVFPEINYDLVKFSQGMDIIIVTTAKTDEEGRELLKQINMPFYEEKI